MNNKITVLGGNTIYKDEVEYYLTRLYYVLDMAEYYDDFQDYLDKKFGYNWVYENITSLEKAVKEWIQWDYEQLEKQIREEEQREWDKIWEEEKKKEQQKKKHQWSVVEIKPFTSRGYKDFTDWDEIGDDFYMD